MKHSRRASIACFAVAWAGVAAVGVAAPVKIFRAQSAQQFLTGTFEGISVDPLGALRLADRADRVAALDEPFLLAAAAHPRGWVVGTGNAGRVLLVDRSGKTSVLFQASEPEVFAVWSDGDGTVYAGTSPRGKVYRIADGKSEVWFEPGETYIWGIQRAADGSLLVATGTQGRLYRVTGKGAGKVFYDSDDTHVRALQVLASGDVLLGTAGEGLVLRVDSQGRARTLFDSDKSEIVGFAVAPDGTAYTAALQSEAGLVGQAEAQSRGGKSEKGDGAEKEADKDEAQAVVTVTAEGEGATASAAARGQRSEVLRIAANGTVESVWSFDNETVYALSWQRGRLWVGTGLEGKLYSLQDGRMILEKDVDERQIVALAADQPGPAFATTNAAALYRLVAGQERKGTYTSMALDAGQIAAAEAAFHEDLEWATRSRQPLEEFSARFGLARAAASRGDWTAAQSQFDAATRVARDNNLVGYLPQLEYEYGMIALRSGNLTEAERRFRRLLASRSGVSDLDRYAARSRIAEILVRRGEIDQAERALTDATDAVDSLRASLDDRELRVLAFQARRGYDDVDLGFPTVIDGLARGGRVDAALGLAERRRARELRDRIIQASGRLTRRFGATPAALRADPRTVVLEYVTGSGGQPTTLFVISAHGVSASRRPPADSLAADLAAFAGMVEAGASASTLGREIGDALLGGVLDSLGPDVTRLVIVPDGPLYRVPFDALRLRDGRFVIERYAVSVAPSVAVVADLASRTATGAPRARVLALGDPRFAAEVSPPAGSAADVYREAFSTSGGLPRLRGSASEARLVARYGERSELRLRERASEAYLKHAPLDSFDIIHLATHALVDDRSVARTALAVADGGGDDGFIGPGELSTLRLAARLVVLSACRTAQGVAVRGEGVQGLTAPLLAAGARSVLATQWRIRDAEAVHFIDDFYRALAAGAPVAEAARDAKLAAIARGASAASWAAFSIVGDPNVTVPVTLPGPAPQSIVGSVAALAAAALAYWVVRRTRRTADLTSVPSASRADTVQ